jgi:hypothetical protein
MAEPCAALLLFQVAQERNFIHDDLVPALSAALSREGVRNDIFEATLPALDTPDAGDLSAVDALAEKLRQGRYPVCMYTRLWSAEVFSKLRAALPEVVWVYLGDARVAFPGTHHAAAATHVGTLVGIVRAVARGEPVPAEVFSLPPEDLSRAHPQGNLVRLSVGGAPSPERPAVVHGSPGCAYAQDVRGNPFFAGVVFPEKVVTRGCSFCASGGIPRRPAAEVLTSVLGQLDHVLDTAPDTARIQLNDQNPFPYLVPFVERLAARARRPLEVLLETRADWLLGALGVFERALGLADPHGHRLLLFLVGLENLSQTELDRYNKGVTVEDNERVIHACRRLRRLYPRSYSDTRAAFGFVLYNPWTELRDLSLNAQAAERLGLEEFRGQVARSKLRLYPDTALYYKALQEGLLAERFPYEAMDSARRYGYEAEVPWRFLHPATDTAYGVHDAIFRHLGKHEEMPMLLAVVRYLERHPEAVGRSVEAVAREVLRGLGSRLARLRHAPEASRRLDVQTSGRLDVQTSRRLDVQTSGRLDVQTSGRPDDETAARARAAGAGRGALLAAGLEPDVPVPEGGDALPRDSSALTVPRLEALAFEAGRKPALYLTVPREEAPGWLARFQGLCVERVDHDCVVDAVGDVRRRTGAGPGEGTHVDLFVARDPAVARRARAIYEEPRGPSEHLTEMGALLGYPRCCVEAFALLSDRSNNSALRYEAWARTRHEGRRFEPLLANTVALLVPFFPCSYGCPRALEEAEAVRALWASQAPEAAAALVERLGRPVFYVDHARQVAFEGARWEGAVLRYTGLRGVGQGDPAEPVGARFEHALGAVLARGDGLRERGPDAGWEVLQGGVVVARLGRCKPRLGLLFPFGRSDV